MTERKVSPWFYLFSSTIVAALGGLLFGFDTAVILGTTSNLEHVFSLNKFWLGFTVSTALIGTIIGSVSSGKPGEKYGRRKVMMVLALLFAISVLGSALTHNWYLFLFYRFIGGLGVGGASVISPMYIAELAPALMRGRLVAVQQFNIVLGILLAFFLQLPDLKSFSRGCCMALDVRRRNLSGHFICDVALFYPRKSPLVDKI